MKKILAGTVLSVMLPLCGNAQDAMPSDTLTESGRERFARNCAICHGNDARGFGIFLRQLNKKPPDLTLLAKKNGGNFPLRAVYDAIDGRNLPESHGSRDMPIWGETFKSFVTGGSETLVHGRILELIMYLESIQQQ